jgi:DNA segregation ATPase FtsK/SpoIIIE-like protein
MTAASPEPLSFSVEITSSGDRPRPQFRADVNAALQEAADQFRATHEAPSVKVSGIADGGLFELGASWPWVIQVGGTVLGHLIYKAGEEAATAIGKESGKSFYTYLKEALRKRNLKLGAPYDLRLFPDPNHPLASLPPPPPKFEPKKQKPKRKGKARKAPKKKKHKRR